jgi:hypothetical protein
MKNLNNVNQNNMEVKLDTKKLDNVLEILDDLSKLLDDRISDLYQVKGGMQSRHAYMFYRDKVWNAISELKQSIKSE